LCGTDYGTDFGTDCKNDRSSQLIRGADF